MKHQRGLDTGFLVSQTVAVPANRDADSLPSRLHLPLQPRPEIHFNAMVKTGDTVLGSEPIGAPGNAWSCYIHAPTSGAVITADSQQIVIAPDGEDKHLHCETSIPSSSEALTKLLAEKGIRGLGGGGFPTHVKLQPALHTLIVNGVECEPGLTCDEEIMHHNANVLLQALTLLKNLLGLKKCILAIKVHQRDLIERFQSLPGEVEITGVPGRYPIGAERLLINNLTSTHLLPHEIPSQKGIACINVSTLFSIYQAIWQGKPQTSRLVTLYNESAGELSNVQLRFGTPLSHLLNTLGFQYETAPYETTEIKVGGMLSGRFLSVNEACISPETNGLTLPLPKNQLAKDREAPCIRCGKCADVCAQNLRPQQLLWYGADSQQGKKLRLADCFECGACDQVCPSHIPITRRLREKKNILTSKEKEKQLADKARERFERHLERQKRSWHEQQQALRKDRQTVSKSDLIRSAVQRKSSQPDKGSNRDN